MSSAYRLSGCDYSNRWYLTYGVNDYMDQMTKEDLLKTLQEVHSSVTDIVPMEFHFCEDYVQTDIIYTFRDLDGAVREINGQLYGGLLGKAYFPPPCGGSMHKKIFIDESNNWFDKTKQYFFVLKHTLMHELGHKLGLAHSEDPNSVMYPYYNGVTEWSTDDKEALRAVYNRSYTKCYAFQKNVIRPDLPMNFNHEFRRVKEW